METLARSEAGMEPMVLVSMVRDQIRKLLVRCQEATGGLETESVKEKDKSSDDGIA